MKFGERMAIVETEIKFIKKQMYLILALILTSMGVQIW